MSDEDLQIAGRMLDASRETREAIERLTLSVEAERSHTNAARSDIAGEIKGLRREVADLRRMLVGKKGDNGLASRVLLLERSRAQVSWHSIGVVIALVLAAATLAGGLLY